ncbi:MAG: 3-deoxy-7-phosphoheptulonate synthase [Pseudonocardiaceae bacterium]
MNFSLDELPPTEHAGSWRTRPAGQQPEWPDTAALRMVTARLSTSLPLVLPSECDALKRRLGAVANGQAFLLQGGDCAESLDSATSQSLFNTVDTLRRMATILACASSRPVVTLARMAGQYAKPRSNPFEVRNGIELPSYRGDAVNGVQFSAAARMPDPTRLLRTYHASAVTLNMIRAFTAEQFFVSHEGLLLDYEAALTRVDPISGRAYATSGHLLWIGERTRDLDGAHVEYFSTINNPIAVKIGPSTTPEILLQLIERLNPRQEPGRLTLITRIGAIKVRDVLPALIEEVTAAGARVGWVCDPMHGNTISAPSGHKTRRFADILDEVSGFFEVHRALGTTPGGVHIELTGNDVTECVGGRARVSFEDLGSRYESVCDPRLNRDQSLELGFRLGKILEVSSIGPRSRPRMRLLGNRPA